MWHARIEDRLTTYSKLLVCEDVWEASCRGRKVLKVSCFQGYKVLLCTLFFQNTRVLFNIRVVGGSAFYSYLSPQDGRPLYHPAVDRWVRWENVKHVVKSDVTLTHTQLISMTQVLCSPNKSCCSGCVNGFFLLPHWNSPYIQMAFLNFYRLLICTVWAGVDCTPLLGPESWKPVKCLTTHAIKGPESSDRLCASDRVILE